MPEKKKNAPLKRFAASLAARVTKKNPPEKERDPRLARLAARIAEDKGILQTIEDSKASLKAGSYVTLEDITRLAGEKANEERIRVA